jgi:hypothetical protein
MNTSFPRRTDPTVIASLEEQLNSFDLSTRTEAFEQLLALTELDRARLSPRTDIANMHCHTFFSFNAYGHSPTSLVWLARQHRIGLMGIVDFDTLDGADEFLAASERAGIRSSVGVETRTFIPEFADYEINSVGEPGVYYHMGIGFTTKHIPSEAASTLAKMRRAIVERNVGIVARLNDYLAPLYVDYEVDVLPLTPSGNATERHIIAAFMRKADPCGDDKAGFWAERLGLSFEEAYDLVQQPAKLQNVARVRLLKRGGIAYSPPNQNSFPGADQFHEFVVASGAIPCATWLDGTSPGEQKTETLLHLLVSKGVAALNLIPDRNWNVADPALQEIKIHNLYDVVALAQKLDLPLIVGTEMNSPGQKLVDDFDAPELTSLRRDFIDGAHFIYGHTMAQRAVGLGYQSAWAQEHLPNRRERNRFYTDLGRQLMPGSRALLELGPRAAEMHPNQLLHSVRT